MSDIIFRGVRLNRRERTLPDFPWRRVRRLNSLPILIIGFGPIAVAFSQAMVLAPVQAALVALIVGYAIVISFWLACKLQLHIMAKLDGATPVGREPLDWRFDAQEM